MINKSNQYTVILDDDPIVSKLIERSLSIKAQSFDSPKKLLSVASQLSPVAAFVDIHLGDSESGLDIIPELRSRWPFAPILVITVDPDDEAVAHALSAGADDFIQKPIRPKELVARLQARLNDTAEKEAKNTQTIGDIVLDYSHRVLRGKHVERCLSQTEINLLSSLVNARGSIVARSALKRRGWGQVAVSDNALDRKMYEVRQAIKEVSQYVAVRTCYGVGFVLEIDNSAMAEPPRPVGYGT